MVYGTEKPPAPRRTRIVIVGVVWVVLGIPLFVGLSFWFGWWVLVGIAAAVWGTIDYVKHGDMYTAVDHAASHHIRMGEDGESRFGSDR